MAGGDRNCYGLALLVGCDQADDQTPFRSPILGCVNAYGCGSGAGTGSPAGDVYSRPPRRICESGGSLKSRVKQLWTIRTYLINSFVSGHDLSTQPEFAERTTTAKSCRAAFRPRKSHLKTAPFLSAEGWRAAPAVGAKRLKWKPKPFMR